MKVKSYRSASQIQALKAIKIALCCSIIVGCAGSETPSDAASVDEIEDTSGDDQGSIPVAIAQIRECGDSDSTDCTNPDDIAPMSRLYLDGTQSYDPAGGTITSYTWEVIISPQGANPDAFTWQGQNSAIASLVTPVAGLYEIRLTVTNEAGAESLPTDQSDVTIESVQSTGIYIQLTWDHPTSNQDLHLTYASVNPNFCSAEYDCNGHNPEPLWFDTVAAGDGPNPSHGGDESNGYGPETIHINAPADGVYRVYSHSPASSSISSPTQSTLRIYVDGALTFEANRTLSPVDQVWYAANITWSGDSFDVDTIDSVADLDDTDCATADGWSFPE